MNKQPDSPKYIHKFEGDAESFIWKHPVCCFNYGDRVIVEENYNAIFFSKGHYGESDIQAVLQPGIHTVSSEIFYDLYIYDVESQQFKTDLYFIRILPEVSYSYLYGLHDLKFSEEAAFTTCEDYSLLMNAIEKQEAIVAAYELLNLSFTLVVSDSRLFFSTIYRYDSCRMNDSIEYDKTLQDKWSLVQAIDNFLHKYLDDCLEKGIFVVFNEDGSLKKQFYNSLKIVMENYLHDYGLDISYLVIDSKINPKHLSLIDEAILQLKIEKEQKEVTKDVFPEHSIRHDVQAVVDVQKPYKGNKPYIFISYSHRNKSEVIKIIARLQKDGFRVWYDEGIDPGTEWDEMIASRVENCELFIAYISKDYLESSNCKDELNFARDIEKKRLLIYLTQTELPAGMKMRLSRIQAIHKYTYSREEDFYQKLIECPSIHTCLEK